MKFIIFLIFFSSSLFAQSMNVAKEAAKSVGTSNNKKAVEVPKTTSKPKDNINTLICPRVSSQFINSSEKSLRSIQDLYNTLTENRSKIEEFYFNFLTLEKTNPEHEIAVSKMVDIKNGLDQKLIRAKQNYNEQLKALASHVVKVKNCWSHIEGENKEKVSKYLDLFQSQSILNDFKSCAKILERNNGHYSSHFRLSLNYFHKTMSQENLMREVKKIDKQLDGSRIYEKKQCEGFVPKGKYSAYFYKEEPPREIVKEKPLDPELPKQENQIQIPFGF